ncbi:hypothetical protein SAMN05216360_12264 [Methylobacterium phyllostachyos]|uniref:Uncharacterized protein n=1 Tax=Methylobacterium phyllostachyos TaxID=582672 RepID=A0A1H0JFW4_9HYPH|nr:hypothetical protein [Methylobacterium phyllostachyos]SDO42647.1 hypothetical protein SAMN05216360_12264 [Methylobacterium phyllostachyos]
MSLIAAKIVVTPTLMWAVSAAARRWGSLVGGLLSGLPLTSAPISIYLAVEQGERFAADAAVGSVEGLGAVTLCSLAYALCAPRLGAVASIGLAFAAFVLGGAVLHGLIRPGLWLATAIDLPMMALVVALCRPAAPAAQPIRRPPRWDMPARLTAATILVLLVSTLAPLLGPGLSGVLSPIPIISWPLIVFARVQDGVGASLDVVRGSAQGAFGVLAFYIGVHATLGAMDPVPAYALSIAASAACVLPWLFARRRPRAA